jgi:2,4-dienoyl-CoA reductase-like NADH-dependent reductase (Old Yellow Enzyme family)
LRTPFDVLRRHFDAKRKNTLTPNITSGKIYSHEEIEKMLDVKCLTVVDFGDELDKLRQIVKRLRK